MPQRPSRSAVGFGRGILRCFLLAPVLASAQLPNDSSESRLGSHRGLDHSDNTIWTTVASDSTARAKHTEHLQFDRPRKDDDLYKYTTERAIATLAPANDKLAVRAPLAQSAGSSAGLSSRQQARSLQDWEVADFVLLATVDGKIYARDRKTGEPRWALEADTPMVEIKYNEGNASRRKFDGQADGQTGENEELVWIVEPSQDGNLYVYSPEPNLGIQRLGLTIKQLVEDLSPFAGQDPPVVYTGEKKNTLYTVDAATGNILKMFSSSGSSIIDEGSCRRVSGLEGLDGEECESIGTLILGRTEYIVGIQNQNTGELICTIRYFEWGPNNRDRDLQDQHMAAMDNRYIYSKFDGSIFALDHTQKGSQRPAYRQRFSSPVVRVYDVAKPFDADARDSSLIVLPQPVGPIYTGDLTSHNVFVNCTKSGSWYAMSEDSYPSVTDGARQAACYNSDWQSRSASDFDNLQSASKKHLVGVHPMSPQFHRKHTNPTISGPEDVSEDNRVHDIDDSSLLNKMDSGKANSVVSLLVSQVMKLVIMTVLAGVALKAFLNRASLFYGSERSASLALSKVTTSLTVNDLIPPEEVPLPSDIDEPPASTVQSQKQLQRQASEETLRDHSQIQDNHVRVDSVLTEESLVQEPSVVQRDGEIAVDASKPKKKAHRGQRGGRKRKKTQTNKDTNKEEEDAVGQIVAGIKEIGNSNGVQPDQVTARSSSITDISDIIELNNLKIYTDKILGAGSGGTFVFEGKFEGRLVAVKRMLPQYFELASQEVSLLQQSDDHPNVIRYFCQQNDQNFLYIAVELCQASIWDLYQGEDTFSQERAARLAEINRDAPSALAQIAAGLCHLHDLRIVHRDIKPQNILIAYPKKNHVNGPRFVISDFGLCKTLPDNASTLIGTTGSAGTVGWKAPELIHIPANIDGKPNSSTVLHSRESSSSSESGAAGTGVKRAVDIFSLGCVFFFVLTGGCHPFDDSEGWIQLRELNVKKGKANLSPLLILGDDMEEPMHLISQMLAYRPECRPSARQVLQHPFFWSLERRLAFLCDVSDYWEREPRDPPSPALEILESYASNVLGPRGDFMLVLDRKFVESLGKQRKYMGHKLLDLLRALRNKRNHYDDLPHDVQFRIGPLPDGYLRYWSTKFPKLLMACYNAVQACGIEGEARFRPYFVSSNRQAPTG